MNDLRIAIIRHCVRKGDRVRHPDYGLATVQKVRKDGAVMIKLDADGLVGTASAMILSRA